MKRTISSIDESHLGLVNNLVFNDVPLEIEINIKPLLNYKEQNFKVTEISAILNVADLQKDFKDELSKHSKLISVNNETLKIGSSLFSNIVLTSKGAIVANNFPSSQPITCYILKQLGIKVLSLLPSPLKMSPNDYVPAGPSLTFVGTGPLTHEPSVRHLLKEKIFYAERVAVVRDLFDRDDSKATLNSVFLLTSPHSCILLDSIIGKENLRRRMVWEYTRDPETGKYFQSRENVEFSEYLEDQGITVYRFPEELYTDRIEIMDIGGNHLLCGNQSICDWLQKVSYECTKSVLNIDYKLFTELSLYIRAPRNWDLKIRENPCLSITPSQIGHVWSHRNSYQGKPTQTTNTILMVVPVGFCTNAETIVDNHFMHKTSESKNTIEHKALLEFSSVLQKIQSCGVNVWLHSPEHFHGTPDAVFPNNWFSTHPSSELGKSTVVFYPMKNPSRRAERREHIISEFHEVYDCEMSFNHWENACIPGFLESTGVLVLDRINKIAYGNISERCSKDIAEIWGKRLGYKMCLFHSTDNQGRDIYHTNVMMSVGTSIAVVCLEAIEDPVEKQDLLHNLNITGKHIVDISREQMGNFCGNCIELQGTQGKKIMCMSEKAYQNFTEDQKKLMLENVDTILHSDLTTIETIGGGSLRCMIGELF